MRDPGSSHYVVDGSDLVVIPTSCGAIVLAGSLDILEPADLDGAGRGPLVDPVGEVPGTPIAEATAFATLDGATA
jgi:hypothetical protein